MTDPRVSIVIPVYNGANYLRGAIDSALAQTYPNFEIIVVNDGSTDGGATEAIAKSYGDQLRYFHKQNGHVASALNYGIRHMTGEYFSWLSHDDLYRPEKIAAQIECTKVNPPRTVVYSDFEILNAETGSVTPARLPHIEPAHFRHFIANNSMLHGCTVLVPKPCFDECGTFDETLRTTQDYDMWFRLARHCSFVHLPRVLVTSRHHSQQGTHQLRDVAVAECNRLLTGFVRELRPTEMLAATGSSLARSYAAMAATFAARGFTEASHVAGSLARDALELEPPAARMTDVLYVLWQRRIRPMMNRLRRSAARIRGFAIGLARRAQGSILPNPSPKPKFSAIYRDNVFGGAESRSGGGSSMEQTATIRTEIPRLLRELSVRKFGDAPCGDFNWMQHANLEVDQYVGIDIVEEIITQNQQRFGSSKRQFVCLNIVEDPLPQVDLILCRDCLVHLNYRQAIRALGNFQRSGAMYLLTTTFTDREKNVDLVGNDIWRTLNLELPPFNFPRPLQLINENCTEANGAYGDKCLGLWALQDLEL